MHASPNPSAPNAKEFVFDNYGIIRLRQQSHLKDPAQALAEATLSNQVIRLSRSSFAMSNDFDQALPWHQHLLATAANAGDSRQAVIVGHSAALWHGLWIYEHTPAEVELHRCPASRSFDTGIRHYDAHVSRAEELLIDGLPVTTVERTVIDIYRMHGAGAALVTAISAVKKGLCTVDSIKSAIEDVEWNFRLKDLHKVLDKVTTEARNPLEAVAYAQCALTQFAELAPTISDGVITIADGTQYAISTTACPLWLQATALDDEPAKETPQLPAAGVHIINAPEIFNGDFITAIVEKHHDNTNRVMTTAEKVNAEIANLFF